MSCTPQPNNPGGALDASETTAVRGGIAEHVHRGSPCNITFTSYEEKYRYLRGKAACSQGTIKFPCCTTTTQACNSCTEEVS